MLTQFTGVFAADNINIENMVNKSKGDYAYTVLDVTSAVDDAAVKQLESIDGVLKVRVL